MDGDNKPRYIKVSRSITFNIPGTDFKPQKVQVDLSREIAYDESYEEARKALRKDLNILMLEEVHNHCLQAVDIVDAPDIDKLMDYLEREIENG